MLFSRKIDDPAWADQFAPFGYEHMAHVNLVRLARSLICFVIVGESFLEHKRDAFAHDTYRIDGVDEGLRFGGEQIAAGETDHHQKYQLGRSATGTANP